jgi:hypothetical protein
MLNKFKDSGAIAGRRKAKKKIIPMNVYLI